MQKQPSSLSKTGRLKAREIDKKFPEVYYIMQCPPSTIKVGFLCVFKEIGFEPLTF
jgi:hypothetical protein